MFDLFAALDATDEQLDFPILYGSGRNGWMAAAPEGPKRPGPRAAVRPRAEARAAGRRSRTGRSACSARCWRPTPSSAASSPGRIASGTVKPEPDHQGPRPRRQAGRDRPRLEDPGLPRPRAPADRARRGRRHRRHRRPREGHRRRHLLRARGRRRRSRPSRSTRRPSPCRSSSTIGRSPAPRATRSRAA